MEVCPAQLRNSIMYSKTVSKPNWIPNNPTLVCNEIVLRRTTLARGVSSKGLKNPNTNYQGAEVASKSVGTLPPPESSSCL